MRAIVALALSLAAAPALAQQPEPGRLDVQRADRYQPAQPYRAGRGRRVRHVRRAGASGRTAASSPRRCTADSVAWFPERNLLYLIGRVHFRDSLSLLDADRVTYWVAQEQHVRRGPRLHQEPAHRHGPPRPQPRLLSGRAADPGHPRDPGAPAADHPLLFREAHGVGGYRALRRGGGPGPHARRRPDVGRRQPHHRPLRHGGARRFGTARPDARRGRAGRAAAGQRHRHRRLPPEGQCSSPSP